MPGLEKEVSSSPSFSNCWIKDSDKVLYTKSFVSLGFSGSMSKGVNFPSIRNIGGTPTVMCMSEALFSIPILSSSTMFIYFLLS